jgi:ketosteroid isomerase-like protein
MAEHPHITLIRKGYDAFSRGDLETLRGLFTNDVVQHQPGSSPLAGVYKGPDAVFELYGRLAQETGGTFSVELKNCFTDGAGHVVALHQARARRNGKSIDRPEVLSFTIVGDRVVDIAALDANIDEADAFWS